MGQLSKSVCGGGVRVHDVSHAAFLAPSRAPNFACKFHSWTGRTAIADFITASQKGMDNGAFIMHRIHGSSVDLAGDRAVVKMKATITQRFVLPPEGSVVYFVLEHLTVGC